MSNLKTTSNSQSPPSSPASSASQGILVDSELRQLLGSAIRCEAGAPPSSQVQPASVDLRLGRVAHRMRAGFLPGQVPVHERLAELSGSELQLDGEGAVLERGLVYLIELEESLDLPADIQGRFNPRSSTGRCDLFTRVLISKHPRFDETPMGYKGKLWLEVAPLSFPVRLKRGDRLCQLRLQRGVSSMTRDELIAEHERTPLCYLGERPLSTDEVRFDEDGSIAMRVGLSERDPAGWRAAMNTEVVTFAGDGLHERDDFWEPVHARKGTCVLEPERFYIFASRERISIPPHLAAEMLPIDVGIGELRNNYAGFFDPGFGWNPEQPGGTPAVLEVRAHDVPFLVEDGQVFFRLRFFRTQGKVTDLYGAGRSGPSYRAQDLTLARTFKVSAGAELR